MFSKPSKNNTTFSVTLPSSKHSNTRPSVTPVRDWESSFGQLSSSYGFNGGVPSVPQKHKSTPRSTTPSSFSGSSQTPPSTTTKNWESSFGQLTSSYGFGGGVPSLPESRKTSSPSKSSKTKKSSTGAGQLLEENGFGPNGLYFRT